MTWPRSTWTAWRSDSTNLSFSVLWGEGEGLDPRSCTPDLCSCLPGPCTQLWLSPPPLPGWNVMNHLTTKTDWETLSRTTCNIPLPSSPPLPFCFSSALWFNLYSLVPLYICQTRGRLTGVELTFLRPQSKQPDYNSTPCWQDSKSSAVSCLIRTNTEREPQLMPTTGWYFVFVCNTVNGAICCWWTSHVVLYYIWTISWVKLTHEGKLRVTRSLVTSDGHICTVELSWT